MPLDSHNYWRHRSTQRTPDAAPQHAVGFASGDRKRKGRKEAAARKCLRLTPFEVPFTIQAKRSERDAENAHSMYLLWLALRGEGKEVPTLDDLAARYGVERHWFARRHRDWYACEGALSHKEHSGRPSTVTKEMINALSVWAEKEEWVFSYAFATDALHDRGWTEAKLKLFVINRWEVEFLVIKPLLTRQHQQARVEFAADNIDPALTVCEVQADESQWKTRKDGRVQVKHPPDRPDAKYAHDPDKTKRPAIMVLIVTARPNPRYDFDGKIACLRVAYPYTAKKASKNHKRGDTYQKDCNMKAEKFFSMMKDEVFPAIATKMWWMKGKVVLYRVDKASSHTGHKMFQRLNELGQSFNPKIKYDYQSAKSPDTNVHDIALFPALKHRSHPIQKHLRFYDVDGLWRGVQHVWEQFDTNLIEKAWQDRTLNLHEIIMRDGGNEFEVPHVSAAQRALLVPDFHDDSAYDAYL